MFGYKRVPLRGGGTEIMAEKLASWIVAEGHSVICYSHCGHYVGGAESGGKQLSEYKGIKIKTAPTINQKGPAAMTLSFFAIIKAAFGHYDIIHIHAEGPAAICWAPRLCGKMVVVTVCGLDWKGEKWKGSFGSKYIESGEKCTAEFADQIIVLSEGVQNYFMDTYDRKAVFIPNGVNRSVKGEPDEIRRRQGLEKDSYILFLGRLVPEEGLRYLVEAYKGLKTYEKLVTVSGGSDTDAFTKELKQSCAGLKDGVIFTGFIQGKTSNEPCGNCYLYVFPSDLEGIPLSLFGAMSYGNCCVVSDVEECRFVITDTDGGQNAAAFRKSDVENLTGGLRILLDNDTLVQKYKNEATDYICEKCGWGRVIGKMTGVYRKTGARR